MKFTLKFLCIHWMPVGANTRGSQMHAFRQLCSFHCVRDTCNIPWPSSSWQYIYAWNCGNSLVLQTPCCDDRKPLVFPDNKKDGEKKARRFAWCIFLSFSSYSEYLWENAAEVVAVCRPTLCTVLRCGSSSTNAKCRRRDWESALYWHAWFWKPTLFSQVTAANARVFSPLIW